MATVSTKVFGTNVVSKTTDSFSINSAAIPHSSTTVTATNVRDAIEEVSSQIKVSTTAPTVAVAEGDVWYDSDDDKFYVRDEDSWNEIFTSISGTVDGGSY